MGKNRCKSTKISKMWETMGNPMPAGNYDDLQPIAQNMKPTLCVPDENLSYCLLSKLRGVVVKVADELASQVYQNTFENFRELK